MEPQETIYCHENKEEKCHKKTNCLGIIAIILLILFFTGLGLIIGAALSRAILSVLPAIIVLEIILGLFLIFAIILMVCNRKKGKKARCKCCL